MCLSVSLLRGLAALLWVHALRAWGEGQAAVQLGIREGISQTVLYSGAGLGLILAGWLSRRLQARWSLDETKS